MDPHISMAFLAYASGQSLNTFRLFHRLVEHHVAPCVAGHCICALVNLFP